LIDERYGAALAIFAAAGVTDGLDGFIAKRWDRCTRVGAMLDPLADKLLVVSSVVLLSGHDRLPVWLAITVVGRDVAIVSGAVVFRALLGPLEVAPTRLSKWNTFAQIGLILLVLVDGAGVVGLSPWLPALSVVVLATTAISGAQYVAVWGLRASQMRE
jgi:cardiolipin synthase